LRRQQLTIYTGAGGQAEWDREGGMVTNFIRKGDVEMAEKIRASGSEPLDKIVNTRRRNARNTRREKIIEED
jgi:hypothetical protein